MRLPCPVRRFLLEKFNVSSSTLGGKTATSSCIRCEGAANQCHSMQHHKPYSQRKLSSNRGFKPALAFAAANTGKLDGNTRRWISRNTWNWGSSSSSDNSSSASIEKGAVSGSSSWFPLQHSNAIVDSRSDGSESSTDSVVQKSILEKCAELHSSIMPLNEKLRGPLAKNSDQGTALPFVLFVGNHSSGKSSFINYILKRPVQTAGVAPTDDNFTIIAPGPSDVDRDGPALIGDPDMGFRNLRQFGPALMHHTQLKIRSDTDITDFMLVDSPGMIDSPGNYDGMLTPQSKQMDRGYDFQNVVKWFAERADVVLLFFDPDKPGTTGETLSILLHSLGGMDHKLLIVLNKADQFRKIHDFARAYGSLCWNLSKVIPRKDLPRIFTMCLPVKGRGPAGDQDGSSGMTTLGAASETESVGNSALADLHQTRTDVVAEVMKAPKRRVDNMITYLHDSVHQLQMHALIAEDLRNQYAKLVWDQRLQIGSIGIVMSGLSGAGMHFGIPIQFTGGAVVATILTVGALGWFQLGQKKDLDLYLTSPEGLSAAFQRTHMNEIRDADEFTVNIWQRIREPLRMGISGLGLDSLPGVSRKELDQLSWILEGEVPRLRRLASPAHVGSAKAKVS